MDRSSSASWNRRLRQERIGRNWRQQDLADQLGTTVATIKRWERGSQQPSAYFRVKLCALFGTSVQEFGFVEPVPQLPLVSKEAFEETTPMQALPPEGRPTLWTVSYLRNPFFLGRDEELAHVRRCLQAGQTMALSQPQAISGLGGIGKTQLALEYAYRYAQDYQAVLWARAESAEALVASYVAFADCLALPQREEQEQAVIVEAVKCWLGTHHDWLLILDNADELAILPDFLPSLFGGHVLITTRAQATGRLASRIEIEALSPVQGALLLLRRSGWLAADAELSLASSEEQAQALQISEELGGLPLALDQAGAYLEETGASLAEYWQFYRQNRAGLLRERRGGFIADHPLPVATTWSLSFQRIAARSPIAADMLRLFAWLPADAIAEEIVSAGSALLGPVLAPIAGSGLLLNQAIEVLRAYSLVRRDPKARMLSMHRLVQAILQELQGDKERQTWRERVVRAVNAAFPHAEYETWGQCERLLSSALSAAAHIEQQQMLFEEAGRLLFETASYLHDRARYDEAELLYERALSIREQILGPDHLDVAYSLNNLAVLSWKQGKYRQAELLCQRALSIRERHLGPEHPDVARSLNNLALFSNAQGKYAEAELLYEQAIHIQEQHLGPEHPDVAHSLNNLAVLSWQQGKYIQAELFYQRALAIWELHLGLDHPLVASPLIGLASLCRDQGKYAEAELLYEQAIHIQEQHLGPEHPDVAYSLNNLAELYTKQGKYAEAEPLHQRILSIQEQRLRPDHPDVAYSLNGLASLYGRQGRYAEAEPLFQRALRIREQHLGPDRPETAETLHDLATLRERQGHYQEALPLSQRALTIREQAFGMAHPKTTETRTCVIALLHAMGQHEEAAILEAVQSGTEKLEHEPTRAQEH